MKLKTDFILRCGATFAILIGICWTAFNFMQAGNHRNKMRTKLETIGQLQEMKEKNDMLAASFVLLQSISNAASSLAALASANAGGTTPEIRELDAHSLGRGLNIKRTEMIIREINLSVLADFLRAAETQCPPWRLLECVISSSPKIDGYGTAILTMETVAR